MDRPLLLASGNPKGSSYYSISSVSVSESISRKPSALELKNAINGGLPESQSIQQFGDPLLEHRNIKHPTTNIETMAHILKGNIGTGVLALPQSLIYSGLAFGTVGLVLVAGICIHCMQMLLLCSQKLCIRAKCPPLDYASTAEMAFKSGPKKYQYLAPWGRFFCNLFIVITQLGFCLVYWVFVASNIQTAVGFFDPNLVWDYRVYMVLLALPLIAMVFVPSLKYLAPISVIANVCEVVAFCMLFYYLFQDVPDPKYRRQFPTLSGLPLWFGTVVYAFEGIALVLPLENNMARPRDMRGFTGVLNISMMLVVILYVAVSFFGYLKYGDDLKGSITLSLPNEIPAVIIQIAYGAGIFFSLALQFYVPVHIMWPTVKRWFRKEIRPLAKAIFKILLLAIVFGLGALIPQFELFISLVGALGGSFLSLVFPAVLHIVTYYPEGLSPVVIAKDIFIVFIGFVGFATGTYCSILNIIEAFEANS